MTYIIFSKNDGSIDGRGMASHFVVTASKGLMSSEDCQTKDQNSL